MLPDWNLILGFTIFAAAMVGGFVKLRVDIVAKFGGVYSRLDKIETQLKLEEKYQDQRRADMLIRMRDVVSTYCKSDCPHRRGTNPGIQLPTDGV